MRIYFSGVNQNQWLEAMKGQLVLESFADIRPLTDRYRGTWAGGMLDSGAFTEMNTGKPIDLSAYTDFCVEHGAFYDAIINLDDIRGNVDKSLANLAHLRDAGVDAMPVFHQGEPWSVLEDMAAESDYIGVGFQRPIQSAHQFLDGVWGRVGDTKVHGFAMTAWMDSFPFYSVDSTTWLWEVKGLMGVRTPNGNPLTYLTPAELVDIVLLKYQRMTKADKWQGQDNMSQQEMFQ